MAREEGLMKPPSSVGAAANEKTAPSPRKVSVVAKGKGTAGKAGSGASRSTTSLPTQPSSPASRTRLEGENGDCLPWCPCNPRRGSISAMGGTFSPALGQVASLFGELTDEQELAQVLGQVSDYSYD